MIVVNWAATAGLAVAATVAAAIEEEEEAATAV
jgi:hypothetical protein